MQLTTDIYAVDILSLSSHYAHALVNITVIKLSSSKIQLTGNAARRILTNSSGRQ